MAFIEAVHLTKIFGKHPQRALARLEAGATKETLLAETGHIVGLHDVSISVERGEIFVVMGLSGCGKSTLIRHLNRLIDPTGGSVTIDGADLMSLSIRELERYRRERMAMVFQRFGLLPHRTVAENVAYPLEIRGIGRQERRKRALEWVATVGLDGYEDRYPAELSGGMQQRVGLARALCADAEILLMDEAFSALDPLIRSQMQDLLMKLQERLKKTIVFITHDLDEALRLGDRIAILRDGALVQVGAPADILLHPADAYVRAFVKDVNRARVLTVETVMKPPPLRLTDETLEEALAAMQREGARVGYVVGAGGYRGVVTRDALDAAMARPDDVDIGDIIMDAPSIDPGASLAEALPATLASKFPVAVVDDQGRLAGVLSTDRVGEIFTLPAEDSTPTNTAVLPSDPDAAIR